MGTPFPCVPAAFQQWERRFHAFPPRNDPWRRRASDSNETPSDLGLLELEELT